MKRETQAGFTLVEALVAMVVLAFGLIAITNLFIVSAGSNTVANHSTAAAAQAAEVMERLKAIPFTTLQGWAPGGSLTGAAPTCDPDVDANGCIGAGVFGMRRSIDGVGFIDVRWQISPVNAGGPDTLFVQVRAESEAPLAGARSRADFTTFRTCTTNPGCP